MTQTSQTEIEDDDELGLALLAFVDQSLANGARCEDVIFALAAETTRAALDLQVDRAVALQVVLGAVSSVAAISTVFELSHPSTGEVDPRKASPCSDETHS